VKAQARSVVLALGSNLGDRRDILQGCVDAIAAIPEVQLMAVSPVYETVPVGGPAQPEYLNAVLLARTTVPSRALLDRLHEIESAFDRVREVRWGPRTLDIDIITVDGEASDDPELTLPHPRAHERAFVLAPWHDMTPDAILPGHGPISALLAATDVTGIRRTNAMLALAPRSDGVTEEDQAVPPKGGQGGMGGQAVPPCGGSPGGRPPGEKQ
jgi:2-amino-4-hydroxy-6-hydroxymethyldihydropteridine diphosphokinase